MAWILLLASIGFFISLYAYILEYRLAKNPSYHPSCDISTWISCTSSFKSSYGKIYGISNTIIGICFYIVVIIFAVFDMYWLVFCLAIASLLMSIYFAYVSYVILKNLCPVCTSIYLINIGLVVASYISL